MALTPGSTFALFATAYVTVLVAELVGDKTLYSLGTLSTWFRPAPILAGACFAFALKMLAAVSLGQVIGTLPRAFVTGLSAITFFSMALAFAMKPLPPLEPTELPPPRRFVHAAVTSFAAIFFAEWADAGQLAAAMLVSQRHSPVLIWCAASLAMATKATLATALGVGLRRFVPREAMRSASVALCIVMGLLVTFQVDV